MHSQFSDTYLINKRSSLKLIAGSFLSTSAVLVACGGGSSSSAASTVPGVPTDMKAVAGNASITLTFTAPASNGGDAVVQCLERLSYGADRPHSQRKIPHLPVSNHESSLTNQGSIQAGCVRHRAATESCCELGQRQT